MGHVAKVVINEGSRLGRSAEVLWTVGWARPRLEISSFGNGARRVALEHRVIRRAARELPLRSAACLVRRPHWWHRADDAAAGVAYIVERPKSPTPSTRVRRNIVYSFDSDLGAMRLQFQDRKNG